MDGWTRERCSASHGLRSRDINVTVAGSADAEVGEVGSQAARAVRRAEQGEGHGVVGVQRGGQRRRELDVGQIRK